MVVLIIQQSKRIRKEREEKGREGTGVKKERKEKAKVGCGLRDKVRVLYINGAARQGLAEEENRIRRPLWRKQDSNSFFFSFSFFFQIFSSDHDFNKRFREIN